MGAVSFVKTSEGYRPAKDFVNTPFSISLFGKEYTTTGFFKTQDGADVYEMRLKSGLRFYVTENHKFFKFVGDGEYEKTQLKDLKVKDKIKVDYTPINYRHNQEEFEKGFLAGTVFAEGTIPKTSGSSRYLYIGFSLGKEEFDCEEYVCYLIEKYLGAVTYFRQHCQKPDTCKECRISKKEYFNKFEAIFGTLEKDEFELLNNSPSFIWGFISAFFTFDGTVQPNKLIITQSNTRGFKILSRIQLFLSSFGIYSWFGLRNKATVNKHGRNNGDSWQLVIHEPDVIRKYLYVPNKRKADLLNSCKSINSNYLINSKKHQEIMEIKYIGKYPVYNITVSEVHKYTLNGAVTKNCGEYLAPSHSSCNLASINILRFVEDGNKFNYKLFRSAIETLTRALTAISYYADYPLPELQQGSHKYHNIGIGLTNLAAFLLKYRVPYDSEQAANVVENIYAFMKVVASIESQKIAEEVAPYPEYTERHMEVYEIYQDRALGLKPLDIYELNGFHQETVDLWSSFDVKLPMANSQVLVQAPTGTISFFMGADSTGIEPFFSLVSYKQLMEGEMLKIVPETIKEVIEEHIGNKGVEYVLENGVLPKDAPDELVKLLRVAVSDDERIVADNMNRLKIAAAAQRFVSSGISITYNLPNSATPEDIGKIYWEAWKHGLKGVTVYRDGCKASQALYAKIEEEAGKPPVAKRIPLPDSRAAKVKKFRVGTTKGYIITGEYPDGSLGEMFIKIAKEGSTLSGLVDSLATVFSIALQHGVPLEILVEKLKNTRFEPAGFTGEQEIPSATSIVDYIAKYLEKEYIKEKDDKKSVDKFTASGMICSKCGGEMLKKGSCFVCQQCGESSGTCE